MAGGSEYVGSGEHTRLISRSALVISRWNAAVDVSLHECFDSIPNLMMSSPERSAMRRNAEFTTENRAIIATHN